MNKLQRLLEELNAILYDDNININKPEIKQELKAIIEQVQNELNEEY